MTLLLLVLCGAAVLRFPLWSSRVLSRRLSDFFHRPAGVGEVHYRFFPLEVDVRDIWVAGATPGAPPFLQIPHLVAVPRLRPLWERRAILGGLTIEGAVVRVNAFREGGDDLPSLGGGGAGSEGQVRIDHLVVRGSEIVVNHQRVPLELDLPGFDGRLSGDRRRTLRGHVAFGPGSLRFGDNPVLSVSSEADLALAGTRLQVEGGRARAPRTDLTYHGRIDLAPRPQGQLVIEGPVDLAVVDRHVTRTGLGLQGAARYDGMVTLDGSEVGLNGRVEGTEGRFDDVSIPRYAGQVIWDGHGLRLRGLELAALQGRARLDVDVPSGGGPARVEGSFDDVDAEALARALFEVGEMGLGASATGRVAVDWPRGHVRELSGTATADLIRRTDGRTPLEGRFEWSSRRGVQTLEAVDLRTPAAQARLRGRIERDLRADLEVDGEAADLAEADALGVRLRRALGTARPEPAGFTGSGSFRGHWRGSLADPVFEGRFTGQDFGYLGVVWGRAEWAGVADARAVQSRSLVLRREGAELWLDGRSETGDSGQADGIDLRMRLKDWPAQDFARALDWKLDAQGPVSGEVTVTGRRSDPHGSARLTLPAGRYYGVPFTAAEVTTLLKGPVTEVTRGRARLGGGLLSFSGTVTDDGVYDGTAEAQDVELDDLLPDTVPELRWGGKVSGRAVLQGPLAKPRVQGRLSSPHVFLGDEGAGSLEASFTGEGDGQVSVQGRCRSARVDVEVSGRVAAAAPYPAELALTVRGTSLDPFLRARLTSLPASVGIVAAGTVRLWGPLQDPRALSADAEVTDLDVLLPEYPVKNRGPLRLAVREGQLRLRDVRFAGEGTDLAIDGSAALAADGPLKLDLLGSADLRALSLLTRELRGQGASKVAVRVGGTRTAPQLDGTLEIDGAALRARGFPHGLEGVRGQVRFTEGAAQLVGVTGTLAGGPLELEGQASYGPRRPLTFDLHGTGRGLSLRYPEGLHTVLDADLRFYGDFQRQWLGGNIDVRQALWDRRYDVASELLAESRRGPESPSLKEGLHYDLKVTVPGTLRIDNNLAALQARAELQLQGTYEEPVILGHAEVERGRVYFQGNTYVIRRGSLDFTNPHKTEPLFDIEAETRVRAYRVTLKVNGTLDRIYPNLTSDPPLPTPRILALLAGVEDPANLPEVDTQKLAYAGAISLAAGRVSEQMGLEKGAAHLGLDRFSIDPSLARGISNPTARLTVGKRLTPDLNIVYSVDLRSTEERLVSVEWTLSDRVSLLGTRDEVGGIGFDLRLRQSR